VIYVTLVVSYDRGPGNPAYHDGDNGWSEWLRIC
jgi:hypothetical protein